MKFLLKRDTDYYLNHNSIVLCEIFLSTPKIPEYGSIEIIMPSELIIPDKEIGYECYPGQNMQKSKNYPLECVPNS